VYDSLTDSHRVYRKALTTDEALNMMREEFVERSRKIDIILFDIFVSFIKQQNSE
jgi:HD-GYP domain-containing protein (c-di-GMP phosphodiesterase class II)